MAYPRFRRARTHKIIRRATGSDISLNSTAIAELAAATNGPGTGGFDIALPAQVGDTLEWGFNGLVGVAGVVTAFEIYTIVATARTNSFGLGLSASLASTFGPLGWYQDAQGETNSYGRLTGSALYVVQAGDIASGVVTCRPYYAQASASARLLYSSSNLPFQMWLKNLGPVA